MAASAEELIDELLSLLPTPLPQLPPTLREVVEQAIQFAQQGELEMLVALTESIREMAAAFDDENFQPQPMLCNDAAAERLAELDETQPPDQLRCELEEVLKLDPHAIEALVMLGDLAEDREQQIAWYQRASAAAQHQDPENVQTAMPHVRRDMGLNLIESGSLTDAAEILLPALQEDVADPAECRYPLVDVCLRLGWHDEVARIVSNFPEDPLGPIDFAAAILAFAVHGDTADARLLLTAAIRRHPGVAEYLVGATPMPRVGGPITEDTERQVLAAEYLLPSLREVEGTLNWIRNQWMEIADELQHADQSAGDAEFPEDTAPLMELAMELEQEDTRWLLHSAKSKSTGEYVVCIIDGDNLLTARSLPQRPAGADLRPLVLSAIGTPATGKPRKPQTLRVPTKVMAQSLARFCEVFDVAVIAEKPTAALRKQLQPMMEMLAENLQTETQADRSADFEMLHNLPVKDEIWLYGLFHPPFWISEGPVPTRPYMHLAVDVESGTIVHQHLNETRPTMEQIAQQMCRAMSRPMVGKPRQVRALLVDPASIGAGLPIDDATLAKLDQQFAETNVIPGDEQAKQAFDTLIADLLQMQGPVSPAIRDLEGMDDEKMAEFYQILANFYRAKPWNMVGGDQIFEVHCEAWSPSRWAAVVMGQLGQEFGIALYDDPTTAMDMLENPDPSFTGIDTVVVHFNDDFDAVPVDCWYRERNNWALAGPEAHPFVARFTDGELKAIDRQDVDVIMQTLPHVPRFFDHPADQTLSVGEAEQKITFRWLT